MNTPDRAMFLPPWACHGPLNQHVDKARRVLWQELGQGNLPDDQFALDHRDAKCEQATFAQFLRTRAAQEPVVSDAVWAAQTAIWHLFEAGQIDDGSATVALLAIHVGVRRSTGQHPR